MMSVREPCVAGAFYPAEALTCRREIEEHLRRAGTKGLPTSPVAGLVPHAGWAYSGTTAATVFRAVQECCQPSTFVVYGAVHSWGVGRAALMTTGSWWTPLGEMEIDEELASQLLQASEGLVQENARAHVQEHSIEVQVPFLKHLFPEAKLVPLIVPPTAEAVPLGQAVGEVLQERGGEVFVLGTTDLTHYGSHYGFTPQGIGESALRWVKEVNDKRLLDLVVALRAEDIVGETQHHHNACGGGAIAATVATARALGARQGVILEYTTSYDVLPEGVPAHFVGYAGVVFCP